MVRNWQYYKLLKKVQDVIKSHGEGSTEIRKEDIEGDIDKGSVLTVGNSRVEIVGKTGWTDTMAGVCKGIIVLVYGEQDKWVEVVCSLKIGCIPKTLDEGMYEEERSRECTKDEADEIRNSKLVISDTSVVDNGSIKYIQEGNIHFYIVKDREKDRKGRGIINWRMKCEEIIDKMVI